MSTVYRIAGAPDPVDFDVTPAPTATPTVVLFNDEALTAPTGGDPVVVTGAATAWTYQLPATLPIGEYWARLRATTVGGQLEAVDHVYLTAGEISSSGPTLPSVRDVADLLPQRVMTETGDVAETFTSSTHPTDAQVQRLIEQVHATVLASLGTLPEGLWSVAHAVVTLGAAAIVELSYFGGDPQQRVYDELDSRYRQALKDLREAVSLSSATDGPVIGESDGDGALPPPPPSASFPDTYVGSVPLLGVPVTTLHERY